MPSIFFLHTASSLVNFGPHCFNTFPACTTDTRCIAKWMSVHTIILVVVYVFSECNQQSAGPQEQDQGTIPWSKQYGWPHAGTQYCSSNRYVVGPCTAWEHQTMHNCYCSIWITMLSVPESQLNWISHAILPFEDLPYLQVWRTDDDHTGQWRHRSHTYSWTSWHSAW